MCGMQLQHGLAVYVTGHMLQTDRITPDTIPQTRQLPCWQVLLFILIKGEQIVQSDNPARQHTTLMATLLSDNCMYVYVRTRTGDQRHTSSAFQLALEKECNHFIHSYVQRWEAMSSHLAGYTHIPRGSRAWCRCFRWSTVI